MAESTPQPPRAYLDGLRMLARRELSESQLRRRLLDREHDAAIVDDAVARLKQERALDDTRVAAAMARTAIAIKRLGPRGALRQLREAGIDPTLATHAVGEAYAAVDAPTHVGELIARRLGGVHGPIDDKMAARLYRYLVSRGHDAELVSRAIRQRQRQRADE